MRRLIQFIAFAILTLVGPAAVVRTFGAPALIACQCGCNASSETECGCKTPPLAPGPPCSTPQAPGALKAATAAPVAIVTSTPCEETRAPRPQAEPKPWPASVGDNLVWPHAFQALALCREVPEPDRHRSLDRQAQLAVFRI